MKHGPHVGLGLLLHLYDACARLHELCVLPFLFHTVCAPFLWLRSVDEYTYYSNIRIVYAKNMIKFVGCVQLMKTIVLKTVSVMIK